MLLHKISFDNVSHCNCIMLRHFIKDLKNDLNSCYCPYLAFKATSKWLKIFIRKSQENQRWNRNLLRFSFHIREKSILKLTKSKKVLKNLFFARKIRNPSIKRFNEDFKSNILLNVIGDHTLGFMHARKVLYHWTTKYPLSPRRIKIHWNIKIALQYHSTS